MGCDSDDVNLTGHHTIQLDKFTNLTFGEAIRKAREAKKITLRALAKSVGLSAPFLSDVEHGRRNIESQHVFSALCTVLQLDLGIMMKLSQCLSFDRWADRERIPYGKREAIKDLLMDRERVRVQW